MNDARLSILVVGSLGPNQTRIGALSALGHHVIYLYTEFLPEILRISDAVVCIPAVRRNLAEQVRALVAQYEVQVIYSILNAHDLSTELTLELLSGKIGIPIVRHYKEHPCVPTVEERCVLLETDGQIYINEESYEYFRSAYNVRANSAHILDADMLPEAYMLDNFSTKSRCIDGEPHILVAGGLSASHDRLDMRELCLEMDHRRVHVHLYGYMKGTSPEGRPKVPDPATRAIYQKIASRSRYVHLHKYIGPEDFSGLWSRYDAGFMHAKVGSSHEESKFEQMNLPHRYSSYLAAGLPLLVQKGGQEAVEALIEKNNIGFVFDTYDDLADILYDKAIVLNCANVIKTRRRDFSFDHCAPILIEVLKHYAI